MIAREREHSYGVTITWDGPSAGKTTTYAGYTRRHIVAFDNKNITLEGSADPTFRGDADRATPEDLLVASLAACHMLAYLALCARKGIDVVSYVDRAQGVMVERAGAGRFVRVSLAPLVRVARAVDLPDAAALHHVAHAECFIANSVNFPVDVEPDVALAEMEPA